MRRFLAAFTLTLSLLLLGAPAARVQSQVPVPPPVPPAPAPKEGVRLKLPEEVEGKVSTFITVKADTNGKVVKWTSLDQGLALFPMDLLRDTKTAVVLGTKPGLFRIAAVTALGDEPSDLAISYIRVKGDEPPPPPPPPPGPPVNEELVRAFRLAYNSEAEADKVTSKDKLKALYLMASQAEFIGRSDIITGNQLFGAMGAAARSMGVNGKLVKVQAAISSELAKIGLRASDGVVDKAQVAKKFKEIADALGAL